MIENKEVLREGKGGIKEGNRIDVTQRWKTICEAEMSHRVEDKIKRMAVGII